MKRGKWHVLRDGPRLVLTRHLPARFDVVVETRLPASGRARIAHQIRQDVWRELQGQRGFSPVVEVIAQDGELAIRAGGRVATRPFDRAGLAARIAAVLESPANRLRWIKAAGGLA